MAETTETIEKHYCYPADHSNNSALWAALMSKDNDKTTPLETMAMMNGGGFNNTYSNPFFYLIWMWMMRYLNGYGMDGTADNQALNYNNRAITQLQGTVDANHLNDVVIEAIKGNGGSIHELATTLNADYNTMSQAICSVKSAIETVGSNVGFSAERVINAVNQGDTGIINAITTTACATQKSILEQGYQNQLMTERQTGILGSKTDAQTYTLGSKIDEFRAADQLQTCQQTNALKDAIYQGTNALMANISDGRTAVTAGFSQVGYQMSQDTCAILQGQKDQTNQLTTLLTNHWQAETSQALQDAKFEISQQKQNNYLASLINNNCTCGSN